MIVYQALVTIRSGRRPGCGHKQTQAAKIWASWDSTNSQTTPFLSAGRTRYLDRGKQHDPRHYDFDQPLRGAAQPKRAQILLTAVIMHGCSQLVAVQPISEHDSNIPAQLCA
jgi:hypothetical protein